MPDSPMYARYLACRGEHKTHTRYTGMMALATKATCGAFPEVVANSPHLHPMPVSKIRLLTWSNSCFHSYDTGYTRALFSPFIPISGRAIHINQVAVTLFVHVLDQSHKSVVGYYYETLSLLSCARSQAGHALSASVSFWNNEGG